MKLETFNNDMALTKPELIQQYNRVLETVASVASERDAIREALEMARVSLEACHARTIHGEVVTREECHLCKVLAVINHLLPPTK